MASTCAIASVRTPSHPSPRTSRVVAEQLVTGRSSEVQQATRAEPRSPASRSTAASQATARRSRPGGLRMRSVQELEALVNERFKVELEEVQDERDRLYERISQCMELKNNMNMLLDQKRSSLKTMVDLGCNFYVQARMCAQPSNPSRAAAPSHRVSRQCTRVPALRAGPPCLNGACHVCAQTRHLVGVRRCGSRLPRPDDPGRGDRLQHAARGQADRGGGGAHPMKP
eukprot:scaffold112841_cov60-Phaeocystis_antarctica.AAC.2